MLKMSPRTILGAATARDGRRAAVEANDAQGVVRTIEGAVIAAVAMSGDINASMVGPSLSNADLRHSGDDRKGEKATAQALW